MTGTRHESTLPMNYSLTMRVNTGMWENQIYQYSKHSIFKWWINQNDKDEEFEMVDEYIQLLTGRGNKAMGRRKQFVCSLVPSSITKAGYTLSVYVSYPPRRHHFQYFAIYMRRLSTIYDQWVTRIFQKCILISTILGWKGTHRWLKYEIYMWNERGWERSKKSK